MFKNFTQFVLLLISFEAINCYIEPQNESPEQKSLDIRIFGRKIKVNILEIKSSFGGKDDQILDNLSNELSLNRKKRADDNSGNNSLKIIALIVSYQHLLDGGSDNSMMGSAQKV